MESIMTRKRKKGKLVTFAISLIVLFFAGIMYMQIKDSRAELGTLHRQETKLEAQLDDEKKDGGYYERLEERKVYVQTKKYVEEVAKQIGFVYPDEVIYKPQNE